MSYVASLKERVQEAEAERDYYKSMVEAFFNGAVEDGYTSLNHIILAQWGRRRLAEKKSQPALLQGSS